jgi:serine/threonine protein phosphatase PrpC
MSSRHDADTAEIELPPANPVVAKPTPVSALVRIDFGSRTDVGKVRANNEDHFLIARVSRSWDTLMTNVTRDHIPKRFVESGYVMAVADGMGGPAAGEVASLMAISVGTNLALEDVHWNLRIDEQEARDALQKVSRYFREIDRTLTEQASADPSLQGMGTTLTVTYSVGPDLFLCHVGDSRAYLYRRGKLEQLTRDHTLAQALADVGQIDQEDVGTHRLRHVLTKAIGSNAGRIEVQVKHLTLADGDRLLLCTDGLTDLVEDAKIADVLNRFEDSAGACRSLVDLALERGGKDNVTVALGRYSLPDDPDAL